jgi:hypothetical protein
MKHLETQIEPAEAGWSNRISSSMPLMLGLAFVYMFLRVPAAFYRGWVGAEEGTVYLRYAWYSPAWRSLWVGHQGYYSIVPNVLGVLEAHFVPLEYIGYINTYSAVFFELLFVYCVLTCDLFRQPGIKRIAALVSCLLVVPVDSIQLGMIHSQFYLAATAAMILLTTPRRERYLFDGVVVLIAGINGPLSCTLLPFYIWDAWRTRSGARWVRAGLMTVGLVVEVTAVLLTGTGRATGHSTVQFVVMAFFVLGPIMGFLSRGMYFVTARILFAQKLMHWWPLMWAFTTALSVAWIAALVLLYRRLTPLTRRLLLLGSYMVFISLVGAGNRNQELITVGHHYLFVFNEALGLTLVCVAFEPQYSGQLKKLARGMLVLLVLSGLYDDGYFWVYPWTATNWRVEVARWRQDPNHRMKTWPQAWIGLELPKERRQDILPVRIFDSE